MSSASLNYCSFFFIFFFNHTILIQSIFSPIFIYFQSQLTPCTPHLYFYLHKFPAMSYFIQSFSNFNPTLILYLSTFLPLYIFYFLSLSPLHSPSLPPHKTPVQALTVNHFPHFFFQSNHTNSMYLQINFHSFSITAYPLHSPSSITPLFIISHIKSHSIIFKFSHSIYV